MKKESQTLKLTGAGSTEVNSELGFTRNFKESSGHVFGSHFLRMKFYAKSWKHQLSDSFNATFGKSTKIQRWSESL